MLPSASADLLVPRAAKLLARSGHWGGRLRWQGVWCCVGRMKRGEDEEEEEVDEYVEVEKV